MQQSLQMQIKYDKKTKGEGTSEYSEKVVFVKFEEDFLS